MPSTTERTCNVQLGDGANCSTALPLVANQDRAVTTASYPVNVLCSTVQGPSEVSICSAGFMSDCLGECDLNFGGIFCCIWVPKHLHCISKIIVTERWLLATFSFFKSTILVLPCARLFCNFILSKKRKVEFKGIYTVSSVAPCP